MNEILLIILGSLAGIITAFAIEKKPREKIEKPTNSKFVYEMIKKIDEYEKLGIINEEEKEELLSAYREKIPSEHIIIQKVDLNPIKDELINILDQRISEINTKIDALAKIRETRAKQVKPTPPKVSHMPINIPSAKNDDVEDERKELEEIKKKIFDTLSKLEDTEV
ncbi:MAG: hypothetical protein KatS3mg003_2202 [Candidatus Nitrosocaldaceae archaeon]|nr:MAG: hypothetical protein KatS3mg003_0004 [Candidatus Nitrosocaldaceae archaeon]GIU72723.1 MAG: hypothetical protein KatS3mg003_2202 [Candidatus Nitrosocaldaceae archaeon]